MGIDIVELWDFSRPEESEQRFLSALADASPEDALILQTQIARTFGLRRDFSQAREVLSRIEPAIENASARAQAYFHLELGRACASAAHDSEAVTRRDKELARSAYMHAFDLARQGRLDDLAIDALHMMAFVDTALEDQVRWNRKAIAFMESSSQEPAKRWEGSLRNNLGYALHQLGHYEEALAEFQLALAAREREGDPAKIRIARWMIAWTLRSLGRFEDALEIQLRLMQEGAEAGSPDPFVYEELEHLYRELGDHGRAEHYAKKRRAMGATD